MWRAALTALLLLGSTLPALAERIDIDDPALLGPVLFSIDVNEAFSELIPQFEKATGPRVNVLWGGILDLKGRVEGGEVADLHRAIHRHRQHDCLREARATQQSPDLRRDPITESFEAPERW